MNPVAKLALDRALQRVTGDKAEPRAQAAAVKPQSGQVASLGVTVDGPVNHFMFLEGRRHAIDLASSQSALPAAAVITNLERSAAGRPSSYVAGIKSIIDVIKEADHANEA